MKYLHIRIVELLEEKGISKTRISTRPFSNIFYGLMKISVSIFGGSIGIAGMTFKELTQTW